MHRSRRVLIVFASALAVWAAPAAAQDQIAPPGNAGVDEYLETVPGGDGNRQVRPRNPDERSVVAPETRRELERLGPDGKAAAALAAGGAPAGAPEASEDERPGAGGSGRDAPAPGSTLGSAGGGSGGVETVVSRTVATDAGGMGAALPTLLVLTLVAAAGAVVARRRSRTR